VSASSPAERNYGRILPAVAAVALIGTVVIAGGLGSRGDGDDGAQASPPSTVATVAQAPVTTAIPTTATIPKTTLAQPLSQGMSGPEVQNLQQRLADLGFQPGPVDGQFGKLTTAAVWAWETVVEGALQRNATGVVTPERWLTMQDPLAVAPRRPDAGKHTEIYLPQQAIVVFDGLTPIFISHISSGELEAPGDDFSKGKEWCEEVTIDPGENGNVDGTEPLKKGVCGNAWTPGGVFEYYRMVEGVRQSRLGGMRNPVYFNYGIAVHGAYEVPNHPASHGCIRIDNSFSEHFQSIVNIGEQVFVWDGIEEPESYGAQSGLWDWADPNYSTTTSTTSTTLPPTTVGPTTTAPAPPPAPTSATTTTAPPPPAEVTTTTIATVPPG
jgi:lipoprotein-anchoring transpeptidase ErfK/SrfK